MFDLFFPYLSSDADRLACWALAAGLVALGATLAERRRLRRAHLDRVGLMPWTSVFLLSFLAAVVLIAFAISGWLKPA